MTTLADIARQAHVSKMTVSRVLNHPEQVSEAIRHSVEQVIKELNYIPNRAALALSNSRHYVIQFLLLEDIETVEPYYAKLLIYLADELQKLGYTLQISHNRNNISANVDGILVSGGRQNDIAALQMLNQPIVSYGALGSKIPFVDVDNAYGTFLATEYLCQHGIEHIYYIGVKLPEYFAIERLNGYVDATNLYHRKLHIHQLLNSEQQARELINHLKIEPNSAFVAATDRLAVGILTGLNQQHLSVPEDVSVIGFDGIFLNQGIGHQLTTIKQPLPDIAQAMIDNLVMQLEGQTATNRLLPPTLFQGGTTKNYDINCAITR